MRHLLLRIASSKFQPPFPLPEPPSLVCNIAVIIFCLLYQPKDFATINTRRQEYMDSLGTPGTDRRYPWQQSGVLTVFAVNSEILEPTQFGPASVCSADP